MLEAIKSQISYDPDTGEFRWIKADRNHPDLQDQLCGVWIQNRRKTYLLIQIGGKKWRAHRLAWFMTYGEMPNVIDHINGNSRDNRIINLRNVTSLENAQNHLKHTYDVAHKKSGLPAGVKQLPNGMFLARITYRGKCRSIGMFTTPEEAHQRYMEERVKQHDCPPIK